jgi:phage tail-like protein
MRPPDPFRVFNYLVEMNGVEIGGFASVAGVELKVETDDVREGGVNDFVHKIAKQSTYSNLTLKRGITDLTTLWDWCATVVGGVVDRRPLTVVLLDHQGNDTQWRWNFRDAFPVKWSLSELNATSGTVAIESVEFAHHGMIKV